MCTLLTPALFASTCLIPSYAMLADNRHNANLSSFLLWNKDSFLSLLERCSINLRTVLTLETCSIITFQRRWFVCSIMRHSIIVMLSNAMTPYGRSFIKMKTSCFKPNNGDFEWQGPRWTSTRCSCPAIRCSQLKNVNWQMLWCVLLRLSHMGIISLSSEQDPQTVRNFSCLHR